MRRIRRDGLRIEGSIVVVVVVQVVMRARRVSW